MKLIGVVEAKNRLSQLIDSGETITITKHGKPVATLIPLRQQATETAARIRTLRKTGGITLSEAEIVAFTRAGRR